MPSYMQRKKLKHKKQHLRGFQTTVLFKITLLFSAVFVLCIVTACGKKGPPLPPDVLPLPAVTTLSHNLKNDSVHLSWNRPKGKGASSLKGYIVYRSRKAVDDNSLCEKCPITFIKARELHKGTEAFSELIKPGYRYIYKVVATSEYGIIAPDSELIRFTYNAPDKKRRMKKK